MVVISCEIRPLLPMGRGGQEGVKRPPFKPPRILQLRLAAERGPTQGTGAQTESVQDCEGAMTEHTRRHLGRAFDLRFSAR